MLIWLEKFEKLFGFFVKLLWIVAFITFSTYIYREYHKNTFYLRDFKVPVAWVTQGYNGEVVTEAILDEIDKIRQLTLEDWKKNRTTKSTRNNDNEDTQILNEINVEGFNVKSIVKTILSILGKKDKSIGGYVTLSDSTQTISVQISDQITKKISVSKNKPIDDLIHDATLHIMRIKQPLILLSYYMEKRDSLGINEAYYYLVKHRDIIRDFDFYTASSGMSLYEKDFDRADAWADSLLQKFPEEMGTYRSKAYVYLYKFYYGNADSLEKLKYSKLYTEYLKKSIVHNNYDGEKVPLGNTYIELADHYFRTKQVKLGINYLEKSEEIEPLPSYTYNYLGNMYIQQKKYLQAERAIRKAISIESDNGNYWDSLAELNVLQGKDSVAILNLKKALNSRKKVKEVSVEAYKKDPRWQRLQKRKDFLILLSNNSRSLLNAKEKVK